MVKLRYREGKKGRVYYIDFLAGSKRQRETLKIPFNLPNKERSIIANKIRSEKELELNISNGFVKANYTFVEVAEMFKSKYRKKDYRRIKCGIDSFMAIVDKETPISKIEKSDCQDFKDYLITKYKPDTISNYFKAAKRVFEYAIDKNYISSSPFKGIRNVNVPENIKKDILNKSEIKKLLRTKCGNIEVKKAFILACNTGLGAKDCRILKESMIIDGMIVGTRGKGRTKPIPLNDTAKKMLKGRKGKIFNLPSDTAINKSLKTWVKRAKINKHITFYCARHTFGTMLAEHGVDHGTIKDLLGHSTYKYIQRYLHRSDKAKIKAVNLLNA